VDEELVSPDELVHALGLGVMLVDVLDWVGALLARGLVDEGRVGALLADFVALVAPEAVAGGELDAADGAFPAALFSWLG
jgi:hypothetical protein